MVSLKSGLGHYGSVVLLFACLATRVGAARKGDDVNQKLTPSTCNSTSWGNINIRVPSVPEPMGGAAGSICNSSSPFVIVEEVIWRCEKRYCCESVCQCGDDRLTEDICMAQPPRLVPTELICLVQQKLPPRFFRYVCCKDFEEVDTICVPKIDCDAAGGGCAHDCVRGNGPHTCSCRPGYQLTNRTGCTAMSTTTSTTITSPPTSTIPMSSSTTTSTVTSTSSPATTSPPTTGNPTTTATPTPTTRATPTTTANPTITTANPTLMTTAGNITSLPVVMHQGSSTWLLIVLPLFAAILLLFVCFFLLCRKRKPLSVVNEDAQTTGYVNEAYGYAREIRPEQVITKKGCQPIVVSADANPKSIKMIENNVSSRGVASIKGVISKDPRVVYMNHKCANMDDDDRYLNPVSVFASGLPPPYQKEDPYEVIEEGAVGGAPLYVKDPLRGYIRGEAENDLNEKREQIYSEIP